MCYIQFLSQPLLAYGNGPEKEQLVLQVCGGKTPMDSAGDLIIKQPTMLPRNLSAPNPCSNAAVFLNQ